jgi:hypothetical protein
MFSRESTIFSAKYQVLHRPPSVTTNCKKKWKLGGKRLWHDVSFAVLSVVIFLANRAEVSEDNRLLSFLLVRSFLIF